MKYFVKLTDGATYEISEGAYRGIVLATEVPHLVNVLDFGRVTSWVNFRYVVKVWVVQS